MVKVENGDSGALEKKRPGSRLIAAAKSGNVAHLQQALEGGEDIWERDAGGRTALHHAAGLGTFKCRSISPTYIQASLFLILKGMNFKLLPV